MRNPFQAIARYVESRQAARPQEAAGPPAFDLRPLIDGAAREMTREFAQALEERLQSLQAGLRSEVKELEAETWRLRDMLDGRLASIERQLELTASRVETSVHDVQLASTGVKESCRELEAGMRQQLSTAESALRSMREAYERRLRQVEEGYRDKIAVLEESQRELQRANEGAHTYLTGRIRSLASQVSRELERADRAEAVASWQQGFFQSALRRFAGRFQTDRVHCLEDALRLLAHRLAELGAADGVTSLERTEATSEHAQALATAAFQPSESSATPNFAAA